MCQQDPIVPAGSPYTGWHLSELEAFLADPIPDESVIQAASAAREALLAEWARHDTHDQPDLPF